MPNICASTDGSTAPKARAISSRAASGFPDQPVLDRVALRPVPRRLPPGPPLVEGSQWWSLTSPAIRTILDYLDDHPAWLRGLQFSLCPGRVRLPLDPGRIRAGAEITQNYLDRTPPDDTLHALHFIDWSVAASARQADRTIADRPRWQVGDVRPSREPTGPGEAEQTC